MTDFPKLLRAIAGGTQAQENKHDIILHGAAAELERLRALLGDRYKLRDLCPVCLGRLESKP
jgi:hypothetical protein